MIEKKVAVTGFGPSLKEIRIWLLPLLSLVFSFFSFFFIFLPRGREVLLLKRKARALKEERNEFLAKAQLLSSLDEKELKKQGRLSLLALPEKKDVSLILFTLTQPAEKNGFYFDNFEFNLGEMEKEPLKIKEKKKRNETIERIPVKLSLRGRRESLRSLLSDWEEGLPLMEITSFEYRADAQGEVSLDLVANLFYTQQRVAYQPEKIGLRDLTLSPREGEWLNKLEKFKENRITFYRQVITAPPSSGRPNPFILKK